jgi:costal 2 protein
LCRNSSPITFSGQKLSAVEERKMLECEEAIEAVDAAVECKNELICGRKGQGLDNSRVQWEKVN